MTIRIKLTIQEIVVDYEIMTREDERMTMLEEMGRLDDVDGVNFKNEMERIAEKYIPNYLDKVSKRYSSPETSSREKGTILYNILEKNFKEISYGLYQSIKNFLKVLTME